MNDRLSLDPLAYYMQPDQFGSWLSALTGVHISPGGISFSTPGLLSLSGSGGIKSPSVGHVGFSPGTLPPGLAVPQPSISPTSRITAADIKAPSVVRTIPNVSIDTTPAPGSVASVDVPGSSVDTGGVVSTPAGVSGSVTPVYTGPVMTGPASVSASVDVATLFRAHPALWLGLGCAAILLMQRHKR